MKILTQNQIDSFLRGICGQEEQSNYAVDVLKEKLKLLDNRLTEIRSEELKVTLNIEQIEKTIELIQSHKSE